MKQVMRNLSPILIVICASMLSGALLRDQIVSADQISNEIPPPLKRYLDSKAERMLRSPRVRRILERMAASSDPCAAEHNSLLLAQEDYESSQQILTMAEIDLEECEMMNP